MLYINNKTIRIWFIWLCCIVASISCNPTDELTRMLPQHWRNLISNRLYAVIIPDNNTTLHEFLSNEYIALLQNITPSTLNNIRDISIGFSSYPLSMKAFVMYPSYNRQWDPLWIINTPDDAQLIDLWQKSNTNYTFKELYKLKEQSVYEYKTNEQTLYVAKLHHWLIVSTASVVLDDAIRSYLGAMDIIDVDINKLEPNTFIINTPELDEWLSQIMHPQYTSLMNDIFKNVRPMILNIEKQNGQLSLSTRIEINNNQNISSFINNLTSAKNNITLDSYISHDAAAMTFLFNDPDESLTITDYKLTPFDRHLRSIYSNENPSNDSESITMKDYVNAIKNTLDNEIAIEYFPETGREGENEFVFLRKLKHPSVIERIIKGWEKLGFIDNIDGIYLINSVYFQYLLGGNLFPWTNFYLKLHGDMAMLGNPKAAIEKILADQSSRQLMVFNATYKNIRETLYDASSVTILHSKPLNTYLKQYIRAQNYSNFILSYFDWLVLKVTTDDVGKFVELNIQTYRSEGEKYPYVERWNVNMNNQQLIDDPIFTNVAQVRTGHAFVTTTQDGDVNVISNDGTPLITMKTGSDIPIGSVIIVDWYGNGEKVIIQAAGNKLYGWNFRGEQLPNFPIHLSERITTTPIITDIDGNSLLEIIATTEDRRIHLLDYQGKNSVGWPKITNRSIRHRPTVGKWYGEDAIFAIAENTIHAWTFSGDLINGFPSFLNASGSSELYLENDRIYAYGNDGYFYSIGQDNIFPDSLIVYQEIDELITSAVAIHNKPLLGSSTPHLMGIRNYQNNTINKEHVFITHDGNGAFFIIDKIGEIKYTKHTGYASNINYTPQVIDINKDGYKDLLTLSDIGHFTALDIVNDVEINNQIPNYAMEYPIILDMEQDGILEILAQTQGFLRLISLLKYNN